MQQGHSVPGLAGKDPLPRQSHLAPVAYPLLRAPRAVSQAVGGERQGQQHRPERAPLPLSLRALEGVRA